jgi:glycosyltransferase involved in cell wall biosynthesis
MYPKVTIGVCTKNDAFTIREAIESILAQNFQMDLIELIVVDGNSEDQTLSIVKETLDNNNIKSKIFSESTGLGYARQMVVDETKYGYIVWVDGDMTISRSYLSELVAFMEKHPKVGIAKGRLALEQGENLLATLETYSRAAGNMVNYRSKKAFLKSLGTSGSIYRTEAIRQAGGFDKNIKGYGEDWDLEIRVRKAGWSLVTINAEYRDFERHKLTGSTLWRRYWRRGYDNHYFYTKNRGLLRHYRMFPLAAFLGGFFHARKIFKKVRKTAVFLLPFQYTFKMTAWYVGFIHSHLNSYK